MKYVEYVCENAQEVPNITSNLDKAKLVPISIDDGGVIKPVPNWKGVYNVSQGRMCATVVPNYNLVQHKEYFDAFAVALNRLNVPFRMRLTQSFNKAYADIDFIGRNLKFDKLNEEFTTGIRLTNSYDKTLSLSISPRYTRLACTNGMILTRMQYTVHLKHHSKLVKEFEIQIERSIQNIINQSDDLKNWVSQSMLDSIEWNTACLIIEKLFKQRKHRDPILKELGISCIDKEEKGKAYVEYVWDDDTQKKKKLNRWELYNAVTSHLTHGQHISPFIQELYQQKAEKILETPLVTLAKVHSVGKK